MGETRAAEKFYGWSKSVLDTAFLTSDAFVALANSDTIMSLHHNTLLDLFPFLMNIMNYLGHKCQIANIASCYY